MKKQLLQWTIEELKGRFASINFPEFQREPTVWTLAEKRRLIDSMVRQFDIASIYLYEDTDQSVDCIDGRQRLNAIMAFLGLNPESEHNGFELHMDNEIFGEEPDEVPFGDLRGRTFRELEEDRGPSARAFVDQFMAYKLNVVKLSGSLRAEEFNLQFTRLNLGTIINSGEKLHAMVGDLRDECFREGGLGVHEFLNATNIPTRRYARQQVAAQIIAQVFAHANEKNRSGEQIERVDEYAGYARTRHFDLQHLFKANEELSPERLKLVKEIKDLFDLLEPSFAKLEVLRNRAITVSTVLLARSQNIITPEQATELAGFIDEFVARLKWQVGKGLDIDNEFRYLSDFNRHITQASVEKPAVKARADRLAIEYANWTEGRNITGDPEFLKRTGGDPSDLSRG